MILNLYFVDEMWDVWVRKKLFYETYDYLLYKMQMRDIVYFLIIFMYVAVKCVWDWLNCDSTVSYIKICIYYLLKIYGKQ